MSGLEGGSFRSLLAPLDTTPFGEHALPLALAVARKTGATLHLVHAHAPAPVPITEEAETGVTLPDPSLERALAQRDEGYLEELRGRLGKTGVPVESALVQGPVVVALGEYASRAATDLVVMSTHARSGLRRLFHENTADALLRHFDLPILLVHPGEEEEPDFATEAPLRHVLVPLDGSSAAERILAPVVRLAEAFSARVTLLGVVRPSVAAGKILPDEAAPDDRELMKREASEALRYLERVATTIGSRGVVVEARVSVREDTDDAILGFAQRLPEVEGEEPAPEVDLIAMETHARKGLSRLLEGSVAGAVLRKSPVPVLLHHGAGQVASQEK
ncbi:MAG: universal stress protein [Longimicrobiaceae bacterium]